MRRIISGLALVVVAGCLLSGCSPRTKWEYKTVSIPGNGVHDSTLNRYGDDGWELTGFSFAPGRASGGSDQAYYVFKRVKANKDWWKFWK